MCFPILVTCSAPISPCIVVKCRFVWLSNVGRYEETINMTQIKELSKRTNSEFIQHGWMMGHPLQDVFVIRIRISSRGNSATRPTTLVHVSRNVPSRRDFPKINCFCFSMCKKCTPHKCQQWLQSGRLHILPKLQNMLWQELLCATSGRTVEFQRRKSNPTW